MGVKIFNRLLGSPGTGRQLGVGIFLHLVCVALVAAATIGVFFGVGLFSLRDSHRDIISDSGADHALTTTASTMPIPQTTQPGAIGPQLGSTRQPATTSQTGGVSAGQVGEPNEGRGDSHSEPTRFAMASTEIVAGTVTQATDAMTWVVGNKTVRLWGIRPATANLLPSLENVADWVRAKGPVECRKREYSRRYRCSTSAGEDIAEAALLAGVARAASGASLAYRNAEAQAHRQDKGPRTRP